MPEWTAADTQALFALLKKLPHPMPYPAFRLLCGTIVTVAYELIILRERDGVTEVLLTQRPSDDPDWPSAWHYPGTVFRQTDTTIQTVIQRLETEELYAELAGVRFVDYHICPSKRGLGIQLLHIGVLTDDDKHEGTFFDVRNLPEPFINEQRSGLIVALDSFQ